MKKYGLKTDEQSLAKVEESIGLYKKGSNRRFNKKLTELEKVRDHIKVNI